MTINDDRMTMSKKDRHSRNACGSKLNGRADDNDDNDDLSRELGSGEGGISIRRLVGLLETAGVHLSAAGHSLRIKMAPAVPAKLKAEMRASHKEILYYVAWRDDFIQTWLPEGANKDVLEKCRQLAEIVGETETAIAFGGKDGVQGECHAWCANKFSEWLLAGP